MHIKQIGLFSFSIADNGMFQHQGKWCQESAASQYLGMIIKSIFPSCNSSHKMLTYPYFTIITASHMLNYPIPIGLIEDNRWQLWPHITSSHLHTVVYPYMVSEFLIAMLSYKNVPKHSEGVVYHVQRCFGDRFFINFPNYSKLPSALAPGLDYKTRSKSPRLVR